MFVPRVLNPVEVVKFSFTQMLLGKAGIQAMCYLAGKTYSLAVVDNL